MADALHTQASNVDLPQAGALTFPGGLEVEISMAGDESRGALWTCNWSHPDGLDGGVTRRERFQLAQVSPGSAQFEALELVSTTSSAEARLSVPPEGIATVAQVLQEFQCSIEGRNISSLPRLVSDETVENFVEEDLTSSRRRLPLVLVSKDVAEGIPLIDPTRLAKICAGMAEVFVLQDHSVALGLSDLIPRRSGCLNGSVRIYNSGFTRESEPLHHPITLGDTIKSWQKAAFDAELHFLDKVGKISAISHSEGSTIEHVRTALREQLGRHLAQQKTTRTSLEEQVVALNAEIEAKDRYVRELEDELERQRKLWYEYRPSGIGGEPPVIPSGEPGLPEFASVTDALQYASSQWPDDLNILQSAWDSARETDSRRRTEVFAALAAIREVARQTFSGIPFGQNLEAFFRLRFNLRYRQRDHEATVSEYGDYRRFQYDGNRVLFENHITIGPNSESCLQIYFFLDMSARKVVIGYCGRHLPTKGWQS
ncbi:MAG: hypothetical protein JRN08_05310 [Nitrososphaerota archaeon]|nr:hypothetical protein [Nitrososphaerota archaeon]